MADNAFGFRPIQGYGSAYCGQAVSAVIPSTDATAVFLGDAVKLAGGEDTDGLNRTETNMPTVAQAAAGDVIYGVVVGFQPDYTNLTLKHRQASTERIVRVVPARADILFEIQADAAMASGDTGQLVDIVVGSGDTTTGRSAMEADMGTKGTANGQLLILGPSQTVGESFDTSGAGTNLVVQINESVFKTYGGTAISPGV